MVQSGSRERGDIVTGWLTRVVLVLAVVGVIGFDGVTVGMASVSAQDQANTAAQVARDNFAQNHDVEQAYQAALASAHGSDVADVIRPADFSVTKDGDVTLHLSRQIHTVVAHYLPFAALKTAQADGSATPST